ncbi:hypothetical protein [Candidatus Thiodictyon syntrophicum]|jgi:hypothetical protein|uniref:hypothetical protein n=1 Tax=Candidatus Thiodictyon syntrophicum TaxID=1166950 RepID=UPI0012FD9CF7|nr:hypothetical protein [Candidatus Thiodictyon syntrophicum]
MIKIPFPNMALNDVALDAATAPRMFNTRIVQKGDEPFWLLTNVKSIAGGAPGGKIRGLVLHCHGVVTSVGGPFSGLSLGTGIGIDDLRHFTIIQGLVERIYIDACQAAAGSSGQLFCKTMARAAKAVVYAADTDQKTNISDYQFLFQGGVIDDFEGQIWRFDKEGNARQTSPTPPDGSGHSDLLD